MKTTTLKLYSLDFAELRTWLIAGAFVVGNILLPQLMHLLPQGGMTWLPIYLFTLVGAYKYGWKAGLLTAVASPLLNHLLFGMPALGVLPVILCKSVVLALAAGLVAGRSERASLTMLALVIASYQVVGGAFEWALTGSFAAAVQDVRLGLPGIALQLFGGWFIINHLMRK